MEPRSEGPASTAAGAIGGVAAGSDREATAEAQAAIVTPPARQRWRLVLARAASTDARAGRELSEAWDAADESARAGLVRSVYERIVVRGVEFVEVQLTDEAVRHGLGFTMPETVTCEPNEAYGGEGVTFQDTWQFRRPWWGWDWHHNLVKAT